MPDDGYAPTLPNTAPRPVTGATATPSAPDARYQMVSLLGRGGMGEVWLAHDAHVDRDVAIKLMRSDRAHDLDEVARFLREARVQGRLEHPAIVPVHDVGGDDTPYFAMKRLTGVTLADVLEAQARGDDEARTRWPRRTLLARLVDVCLAIELAHRRGVVHRDLKPANIMLGDFGETYVLDWGLARVLANAELPARDLPSSGDAPTHTVAGAMLGTPGYMAPEQVRGEPVDARADVYALGCILYEILAGEAAVPRDRAIEATLEAHELRPSRSPRAVDIAPELDDLAVRATASELAARVASARELGDAIQRFLDGDRDSEQRRALASDLAKRATIAFARDRDAARAEAMRDAGRALALDPMNPDAAALLGRMLLERPKQTPAEAQRAIEDERYRAAQVLLRVGTWVYLAFMVLIVLLKLASAAGMRPFIILEVELALLAGICFVKARRPRALTLPVAVLLLMLHVGMLVTLAFLTGPLLFVPILTFGMLPAAQVIPTIRRPVATVVLLSLGLFVPLALEWLGIVPPTFVYVGDQLVLHTGSVPLSPHLIVTSLVILVLGQMIGVSVLLFSQRCEQERAQEQLHVQKWHLDQLVGERRA